MDGNRFDDFARRLGSGLSRRQMVRSLLGGAGALATTAVLREKVAAQGGFGDSCTVDSNCENSLICSPAQGNTCRCNPSTSNSTCPAGTHHAENTKFLDGQCCNGNGNCCSNVCGDDGYCIPATGPSCSEEGVECGAGCCVGLICFSGFCVVPECTIAGDCTATNECYRAACTGGECVYSPANDLCTEGCEVCNTDGFCVSECGNGICCNDQCVSGDCCVVDDCALSNCARVACTNNVCGAVSLCPPQAPNEVLCCAHEGQPEFDYCYVPAEGGCCFDEECEAVIPSEGTCLIAGCFEGLCGFVRDNELCGQGTCCCENGVCSADCCEQCREFGEECGLIVNGTFLASGSPQLDCCDGLICCEVGNDHVCAECCADRDCPKGYICCAGACREIECCIDDILTGGDPNARCPDGCGCFEGICVDENQQRCRECHDDKDCDKDTCCCKDGTCSHDCCVFICKHDNDCATDTCCCHDGTCSDTCCRDLGCKHDHDCANDTCCCKNGGCSHDCCPDKGDKPDDDKPDDDTPEIDVLPNTGTGPGESNASWFAGAAAVGAAAALLGSQIRNAAKPAEEPEA